MTNDLTMRVASREDAASLYGTPAEDVADRLAVMRRQESTSCYRPVDYLHGRSHHCHPSSSSSCCSMPQTVDPIDHRRSRSSMARWCYQIIDACELSRHSASRSFGYLDRFLSSDHPRARDALADKREYQLAAVAALYLSVKLHEPLAMDASLLAEISRGCYEPSEILDMERCVLRALGWRTSGPTTHEYVSLCLGLLDPEGYYYDLDTMGSLLDVSLLQCELAAMDYDLSTGCVPSVVALAAVFNSLEGADEGRLCPGARCNFIARLCESMLPSDDATALVRVTCVQSMLRRLFCLNSSMVDLPQEITGDEIQETSSNSDHGVTSAVGNKRLPDDIKCSSPVTVAAKRYLPSGCVVPTRGHGSTYR